MRTQCVPGPLPRGRGLGTRLAYPAALLAAFATIASLSEGTTAILPRSAARVRAPRVDYIPREIRDFAEI